MDIPLPSRNSLWSIPQPIPLAQPCSPPSLPEASEGEHPPALPPDFAIEIEAASSSLDAQETSPPCPDVPLLIPPDRQREEYAIRPILPLENSFRHGGWHHTRAKVWAAILETRQLGRIDRFANCGSGATLDLDLDTRELAIHANYCHDRLCVPCCTARARQIADILTSHCHGRLVRFVTLTLRHSRTPLRDQLKRLYQSFAALRRRPFWQSAVKGGCYVCELKLSQFDGLWHVHLHVLVETPWLDQKQLSAEWHKVTGDSSIVDVRPIHDAPAAASYVAKYAAKGTDNSTYQNPDALREYAGAIKGTRLISTFGSWRGVHFNPTARKNVRWYCLGSLTKIIAVAASGNLQCQRWLALLSGKAATIGYVPPLPNST
jgi:hypothetical protein